MVHINVPLTVQQFEHNAVSLQFPGAKSSLSLLVVFIALMVSLAAN